MYQIAQMAYYQKQKNENQNQARATAVIFHPMIHQKLCIDLETYSCRLAEDGLDSVEFIEKELLTEDLDFMEKAQR